MNIGPLETGCRETRRELAQCLLGAHEGCAENRLRHGSDHPVLPRGSAGTSTRRGQHHAESPSGEIRRAHDTNRDRRRAFQRRGGRGIPTPSNDGDRRRVARRLGRHVWRGCRQPPDREAVGGEILGQPLTERCRPVSGENNAWIDSRVSRNPGPRTTGDHVMPCLQPERQRAALGPELGAQRRHYGDEQRRPGGRCHGNGRGIGRGCGHGHGFMCPPPSARAAAARISGSLLFSTSMNAARAVSSSMLESAQRAAFPTS